MVGFENEKEGLEKLAAKVVAISTDPIEDAQKVAHEVFFPVAHGATKADGDAVGAWWGERRGIIQPSEFIIGPDGNVMTSSYSSGPLARLDGADVVRWLTRRESRA